MSRTFQHVRLLPQLTGLGNVASGAHLRGHADVLRAALHLERDEEGRLLAEASRQLDRVTADHIVRNESLANGRPAVRPSDRKRKYSGRWKLRPSNDR